MWPLQVNQTSADGPTIIVLTGTKWNIWIIGKILKRDHEIERLGCGSGRNKGKDWECKLYENLLYEVLILLIKILNKRNVFEAPKLCEKGNEANIFSCDFKIQIFKSGRKTGNGP